MDSKSCEILHWRASSKRKPHVERLLVQSRYRHEASGYFCDHKTHSLSQRNDHRARRHTAHHYYASVDVRLSLDVVARARKREFNVAVIYSQDQDLCEVVQELKDIAAEQKRWITVACAFPSGPNASSGRGIDKTNWFQMDETFYNACLDPRDYRPATM